MAYQQSALWLATLAPRENDLYQDARDRLRVLYEKARKRVEPLVKQAHRDCFGLTIHDLSHLDALWEVASCILGDTSHMAPLEGFIFGASLLLHDTAMAIDSYEGGFRSLKSTDAWDRAVISQLRAHGIPITSDSKSNPPEDVVKSATFATLRALHAEQATKLVEREWRDPVTGTPITLFDDPELVSFYGELIGKIAYSHHWDIERVNKDIPAIGGTSPDLPVDWHLSALKIACLLRCSDAAHIDKRRAPTMDYALLSPSGVSERHWRFQNHLAAPKVTNNNLLFKSGRAFAKNEAEAWWLCYDTCRMVARELEGSDAILQEHCLPRFAARSVEGIARPKLFAAHVECSGWVPVDAEVRVSDPVSLARTLGGTNLYGSGYKAPIRELLQNAIDATKLRKTLGSEDYRPLIRLRVFSDEQSRVRISVEDNGIGMSERVLTTTLIDFGRSMWTSESLIDEYPGIRPSNTSTTGKFGIGFFSTFLLGDKVTVFSRRYDKGPSDAMALEFVGLSRRPILRAAQSVEVSDHFVTKICVTLSDQVASLGVRPAKNEGVGKQLRQKRSVDIFTYCKHLIVSCDIDVQFIDELGDRSFNHEADWMARPNTAFLNDLLIPDGDANDRDATLVVYSDLMTDMRSDSDQGIGRAAIQIAGELPRVSQAYVSVGGLTYEAVARRQVGVANTTTVPPYVGILPGDAPIATRAHGSLSLPEGALASWATQQGTVGQTAHLSLTERVSLAHKIYWAGGDPQTLPIGYLNGRIATLSSLKSFLSETDEICILAIVREHSSDARWTQITDLNAPFFSEPLLIPVFCCSISLERLFQIGRRSGINQIFKREPTGSGSFGGEIEFGSAGIIVDLLSKSGVQPEVLAQEREIFQSGRTTGRFRPVVTFRY